MCSLLELQLMMQKTLLDGDEQALLPLILERGFHPSQRLSIYKNNLNVTLLNTLQTLYPCVLAIVGEDCFSQLAYTYIRQYPPNRSDINLVGQHFPLFLTGFQTRLELPYLEELARFEWARYEVSIAPSFEKIDARRLMHVLKNSLHESALQLNPSAQLIKFQFPILRIFQLCHNEIEHVDLTVGSEYLLITRSMDQVVFEQLCLGSFTLLSALQKGKTITQACELAQQLDTSITVSGYLQHHLLQGTIITSDSL